MSATGRTRDLERPGRRKGRLVQDPDGNMLSVSQHKKLRDKIERQYSVPLESYEANAKSNGNGCSPEPSCGACGMENA